MKIKRVLTALFHHRILRRCLLLCWLIGGVGVLTPELRSQENQQQEFVVVESENGVTMRESKPQHYTSPLIWLGLFLLGMLLVMGMQTYRQLRRPLANPQKTYDRIPLIQQGIKKLEQLPVNAEIHQKIEKQLGKTLAKEVGQYQYQSQWAVYNLLTHIISHRIERQKRARYQQGVSRVFEL